MSPGPLVPAILVKVFSALPSLPPEVEPWLAPSGFLAGLALVLGLQGQRINELRSEMKASEDRQQKAMAELKAELRADLLASEARQQQAMAELKADMQAGEARQQQAMAELKAELKADMQAGEARQQQAMAELKAELKADMQAGEARQQKAMAELKADNRAINEKLDRLIASLGKVQQG